MAFLEVSNLSIDLRGERQNRRLVDQVSFAIEPGEAFCLIGESGCGKSVTALALTRLLPETTFAIASGSIHIDGTDIVPLPAAELRSIRGGKVSYVFQDPVAYLNPVQRVGQQIMEMLSLHQPAKAKEERVVELLELVGIPAPEKRSRNYPHEMSGGMLQRVMIAMALASEPSLLVADEPTTALDVTVQAQILALLRRLQRELGMAVLLISHNLGMVGDFADRVAVMYAGQVVELGETAAVLETARHPYTRALLRALPRLGRAETELATIPGQVPLAGEFPSGCRFHPRCGVAQSICSEQAPELESVEGNRQVRCPFPVEA